MLTTWDMSEYAKKARQAVAEGIVLIKNDNHTLPLKDGQKIAIFGRSQFNYYKSGTGSGGAVNAEYVVGIYDALEKCGRYEIHKGLRGIYEEWIKDHPFEAGEGWASEPWYQEEMPIDAELAISCAKENDLAIVLIGRTAGEDQDNKNEPGSYLLTEDERKILENVTKAFTKTVVLINSGNIMDMSWLDEYSIDSVAYVWQGGQEGGNGVLDVLSGDVCPSGRLSDTVAYSIADYPSTANFGDAVENIHQEDIYVGYRYFETFAKDKVRFPFGFGLSYTEFSYQVTAFSMTEEGVSLSVKVTNIGAMAGKDVMQLYVQAPQGKLGKAARVLCGFAKTKTLAPMEEETLTIEVAGSYLASYDDSGVTGHKSAFVLEAGEYQFFLGENVREATLAGSMKLEELVVLEECEEALAPVKAFTRMKAKETSLGYELIYEDAPTQNLDPNAKRRERLPKEITYTGDQGYKLKDVAENKVSMDTFIGQLSDEELCTMIRGEGMSSTKVTPGIAGAFGGVSDELLAYGIPLGGCSDGPSGIRMDCGIHAFSMPNGTALACSFNEELSEELYEWEALELRKNKIDTLLGPGVNIHRNPLNGRNFEYFSEDPFLTGKMATAQLKGMHKYSVTGTVKHFACNTQEYHRNSINPVVSERALREIYLKAFEMVVKEGQARSIMSTYGPINGIWTASNYDLLTVILRDQWGFDGIVMTDWWAKGNDYAGDEGTLKNVAAQVRAQNDLNMVNGNAKENSNGDNLMEALLDGRLTRAELQRSAANICRFLLTTPAYTRLIGQTTELDEMLKKAGSKEDQDLANMKAIDFVDGAAKIPASDIHTEKLGTTYLLFNVETRGEYAIRMTFRATTGNELAQIPFTVFKDNQIAKTITLRGDETQWRTEEIVFSASMHKSLYVKLFFAQAGIEVKDVEVFLKNNLEEQLKAYFTAKEAD